ncbi:hypothetical protein P7C70_g5402, partial [Phenoliferia sp. Uapishka_3]
MRGGPSTQRFGQSQMPQATNELLHGLIDVQSKVFPISAADSVVRPDTTVADTEAGRTTLTERAGFIRVVLGGWMDSLAQEEGRDGSHSATGPTEAVTILSSSIPGPLQYLRAKPNALLFRPDSAETAQQLPATLAPVAVGVQSATLGNDDLATFLLPRILRATSSLEAALLSTQEPSEDQTDVFAELWRNRQALKLKLEELLFTIVRVLAESAVRIEWHSRDSVVPGGLGKAREMMSEMVKLLRALLPSPSTPHATYPHTFRLFESQKHAPRRSSNDLFDEPGLNITIRSALHSRALLLTIFRVLHSLTTTCPFLSDFSPEFIDILTTTWPTRRPSVNSKGKERVDENYGHILAATLAVVSDIVENSIEAFANQSLTLIAPRIVDEIQTRLQGEDGRSIHEMDVDGKSWESKADAALATIISKFWLIANTSDGAETSQNMLRQVFAGAVLENGERMVDCLMANEATSELRVGTS